MERNHISTCARQTIKALAENKKLMQMEGYYTFTCTRQTSKALMPMT